jgi:hypothetical protein
MARRIGSAIVPLLLVLVTLTGCSAHGDAAAGRVAGQVADRIADEMSPPLIRDVTAEYLVSESVHGPGATALAWSGRTGDRSGDGAHIVLRVHAHLDRAESGWIVTQEEGDAVRCFRLTIRGWRYYDTTTVDATDCPRGPAPPQPTGVQPEKLPDDVDHLLTHELGRHTTALAAGRALRSVLPRYATVDVVAWNGGLVAAVGAPAVQDCAVAVRDATGRTTIAAVDQVQVQPGEIGCRTELVTAPAQ